MAALGSQKRQHSSSRTRNRGPKTQKRENKPPKQEVTGAKGHPVSESGPRLLLCLLLWRTISVFVVRTAHVADEYWQSLEVAHRLAFGYGYLTWEWTRMIRSYLYPGLISLLYRLLALVGLDRPELLISLPRVGQALLSGYADFKFLEFSGGDNWALLSLCLNWYWYYCASRTLLNSVETCLTTIALAWYPFNRQRVPSMAYLWLVGLQVALRPTALVTWSPLILRHLLQQRRGDISRFLFKSLAMALTVSAICLAVDSFFYEKLVFTPWEFFRFNVLRGVGSWYGSHSHHWYLTSGLPVLLGFNYAFFVLGALQVLRHRKWSDKEPVLLCSVFLTIFVYSLLDHKEFRFLLPLLPMLLLVASQGFRGTFQRPEVSNWRVLGRKFPAKRVTMLLMVLCEVLPCLYFSLVHQSGSPEVMRILREEVGSQKVLFLTPCHSTPYYSHLHVNATMRFLTCEPNLDQEDPGYQEEADAFLNDPAEWLKSNPCEDFELVVLYDNVVDKLGDFLSTYDEIARIFDSSFPQGRRGNYFVIYRKRKKVGFE